MTTGFGSTHTPARTRGNGLAIAGMVCGIVGLFLLSIILGPLAMIFGYSGLRTARRGAAHHGMALAGVILGAVDIALFIISLAVASNGGFTWHIG